jgi:hypothetical protein
MVRRSGSSFLVAVSIFLENAQVSQPTLSPAVFLFASRFCLAVLSTCFSLEMAQFDLRPISA